MADTTGSRLVARELPVLFERVHEALASRRESIDDLNVFPVPDGDTGTNMTLTVRAGLEALRDARPAAPEELSRAVIRGTVKGARGNSGVIISQVVRAVVEVVTGHAAVDAALYAQALRRAKELAYEAVAEPVEGTMLTAIAAACDAALEAAERGASLLAVSEAALTATTAAVEASPEQLEALRAADVVDAGARGFEILLAAVHGHLGGQQPQPRMDAPAWSRAVPRPQGVAEPTQAFEVQYLLDAPGAIAGTLRRDLEAVGDSVVVVAADDLLKIHVHTDRPGPAIEVGVRHGRTSDIEVVHLGDEVAARAAPRAHTDVGAVAVVGGHGMVRIARAHGATVVAGGSGALPSVAELLRGIDAVDAARIVVFPGHRSIVATARQAAEVAGLEARASVEVVAAATSPPAVLAGLAVLDPDDERGRTLDEVVAAVDAVRAGEVVGAVRPGTARNGPVRAGQPLAVTDGSVVEACDTWQEALGALCDSLVVDGAELVSLLIGADVRPQERSDAVAFVSARTDAEMEVIDAGCRPSRFWLGVT